MLKLIVFIGKWTQPTVFKPSEERGEKKKKKGREKKRSKYRSYAFRRTGKSEHKAFVLKLREGRRKRGGDGADKTQVGRTKRTSVRRTT